MLKQNIEGLKNTMQRHPFPVDVAIETIAFCNLKCIMCPQSKLTRERGVMSFDLYKKIIDEVAVESPTSRIWLALMGEMMLLGDRIVEMIAYASGKGLAVHVNTNAVLLDEGLADKVIAANPKTFYIGLDAFTQETYDKIRVGGNFDLVIKNVEYLIRHKKPEQAVIMQFIEMAENCHETEAFKEYWLSKRVPVKLRPRLGWGKGVSTDNLIISDKERFPCQWLLRTASIHWSGKMAQCDGDYNTIHSPGDLNKQTIKEVWNGELAKRREWHWNHDFTHEPCKSCKDWQAGRSYFYYP